MVGDPYPSLHPIASPDPKLDRCLNIGNGGDSQHNVVGENPVNKRLAEEIPDTLLGNFVQTNLGQDLKTTGLQTQGAHQADGCAFVRLQLPDGVKRVGCF